MIQVEQPDRPSPATRAVGIVGLFDSPGPLLAAAQRFRDEGFPALHWDCHTPYPVHGLDRAMGLRPSIMGVITLSAAFVGLGLAIWMTGGLSVWQYPIRIGGKPLFSWQAFVPIFFELFVLFATVSTLAALIWLCRLGRWHSPLHDSDVMKEITCDRFAIVLRGDAASALPSGSPLGSARGIEPVEGPLNTYAPGSLERARQVLGECGCTDIRPLIEEACP
jgi:hypothetical protein